MRIGIVTTWFERGASYVSKIYRDLLTQEGHDVFIYARGGEFAKEDSNWNKPYVTWGKKLPFTYIDKNHIFKWIKEQKLDVIFFNEQHEFTIVTSIKMNFTNIKLGSYIDYYTEETIPMFDIYDFIICNTLRHKSAFKNHKQVYYIKWGTDVELFKPKNKEQDDEITFFHSMGMSYRKGTDLLIKAFIKGKLYKHAKLVIHTQLQADKVCKLTEEELRTYKIEVVSKTVTAPGLYHLGDIYVYPTILEGLGLTIYEALACGLPVIITDFPPMNEVVNNDIGMLIDIEEIHSRKDGYYWPLAYCNVDSLIYAMKHFITMDKSKLNIFKTKVRDYAINELNIKERSKEVSAIFEQSKTMPLDENLIHKIINTENKKRKMSLFKLVASGNCIMSLLWKVIK